MTNLKIIFRNENLKKYFFSSFFISLLLFSGIFLFSVYFYFNIVHHEISSIKAAQDDDSSQVLGAASNSTNFIQIAGIRVLKPNAEEFINADLKYKQKLAEIEEAKKRAEEEKRAAFEKKVLDLTNYLNKYKSPMAPYSALILNTCMPYGVHYCKFYLSIAAIESGFGRVPIGCCNAHGIVGIKYASWEESIPKTSAFVYNGYYSKGVDTFEELAYSSYGPKNPEAWIGHLYQYYNELEFI